MKHNQSQMYLILDDSNGKAPEQYPPYNERVCPSLNYVGHDRIYTQTFYLFSWGLFFH
jgi:hypothetical protein